MAHIYKYSPCISYYLQLAVSHLCLIVVSLCIILLLSLYCQVINHTACAKAVGMKVSFSVKLIMLSTQANANVAITIIAIVLHILNVVISNCYCPFPRTEWLNFPNLLLWWLMTLTITLSLFWLLCLCWSYVHCSLHLHVTLFVPGWLISWGWQNSKLGCNFSPFWCKYFWWQQKIDTSRYRHMRQSLLCCVHVESLN